MLHSMVSMTSRKRLMSLVCMSVLLGACSGASIGSQEGRKVLLVSMDGFRHDYFQKANTPNFDAMMASGVHVPYVNNTFVTLTFPCHTTIVTGVYEETHGIIGNRFYDPWYKSNFSSKSLDSKWWNSSEPIWINAVKSGLKVGTFYWPGSTVEHGGRKPTEYREYDYKVNFWHRVDTVVGWLSRDDYDMAILYFNEPDHSGHAYGPDSPLLIPIIEQMDSVLGYLMASLENANVKEKVDVIITSDHGMTAVDMVARTIDITDHVDHTLLDWSIPTTGPALNLMPQPGKARELAETLDKLDHVNAYVKEDIPEHFHYGNNRRVSPVFVYAEEGWMLTMDKESAANTRLKGQHGFDNGLMSMKPIFVANGPSFKSNFRLPGPIKSVDIYPLLCHLLKLEPAPNNGSLERVLPLLRLSSGGTDDVSKPTGSPKVVTTKQPLQEISTSTPSPDGSVVQFPSVITIMHCLVLFAILFLY